jgi:2-polyprenyl-3-methyl-5-hydroxy-6-metoxy-1,4-benzoquinol methylase
VTSLKASGNIGHAVRCPVCLGAVSTRRVQTMRMVLECSAADCRLQFLYPQPTREELSELYRSAYYQPGAPNQNNVYANTPRKVATGLVKTLVARIGPLAGRRVLDFGAGIGVFADDLRALGATVVCVEPDPEARTQIAARGLPCYPTLEDLKAGQATAPFDLVTAIEVIEHLEDPARDLRLLHDVTSPGGTLFLTTPNFQSLRARLQGHRWEQYRNPTHLFYFTPQSLERVMRLAGFASVERLRSRVVYPYHGALRRTVQRGLQLLGLDGDLVMLSSAAAPSADLIDAHRQHSNDS